MGALSFWYFWPIGIRKKWINFIFKKRKIFRGRSKWPIFWIADFPSFFHNFIRKHQNLKSWGCFIKKLKIEEIEPKDATPQKVKLKIGEVEPPLKIFLFLKDEIYPLFSYSYWSKVPKWKCAHNLLCKMSKNCLKLLKIAVWQPPDWIQRKKNTL